MSNPQVLVDYYDLDVVRGFVPGQSFYTKFGYNSDVDTTTTPEDIWNGGGTYTGQPVGSPETLEVFSGDAADTSAGTGMQTIRLHYLATSDSTSESTVDVTLNGVTAVDTGITAYRCYRAYGLTYGSGGTNAGIITIRHDTTTTNVFAQLGAGRGQTTIAAYTIPAGMTGYLESLAINMSRASGAAGSAQVSLRVREFGSGGFNAKRYYGVTTGYPVVPPSPMCTTSFPAKSDIKLTVDSVSDNNSEFSGEFSIRLVED